MIWQYCNATMENVKSASSLIVKKGWDYLACPHCDSVFTKRIFDEHQIIEWKPPFSYKKRPFCEEINKQAENQGTDELPIWAAYAVRHSDNRLFVYENRPIMYRQGKSFYWSTSYGKYALILKRSELYDFEVMPKNNVVELGLEEDVVLSWCRWLFRDEHNQMWGYLNDPFDFQKLEKRVPFKRKNPEWSFIPRNMPIPLVKEKKDETVPFKQLISAEELVYGGLCCEFNLSHYELGDFILYSTNKIKKQKAMIVDMNEEIIFFRTILDGKEEIRSITANSIALGECKIEKISV